MSGISAHPTPSSTPGRHGRLAVQAACVATILLAGFALQAKFAAAYPQPALFGDPLSYLTVGRRLIDALTRWAGGESWSDALASVRGVLYFSGVGTVYGLIDAARPGDLLFLRMVFAGFNTLSMLGGFFLARRLSGGFVGGIAALGILAVYPSFAVELAKAFPDPVTGCCFMWSTVAFVEAIARQRAILAFASGLALGVGLFVRSQLMLYVLLLLVLAGIVGVWLARKHPLSRRLAVATLLGVAPFAALWGAIEQTVGEDIHEIEALGNFTFRSAYPYGFWQFLDSDGWMGTYRLRAEPYYLALEAEAAREGWPVNSRLHQAAFTVRYVVSRPFESLGLVLDNAYRLLDRPPNRYKWDYPYPYQLQVHAHRGIMLLALLGIVLFASSRPAYVSVIFLPASIALLHALSYPWPRFAQPVLPILVALAGAFVGWTLERRRELSLPWKGIRRLGALTASTAALYVAAALARDAAPGPYRWARLLVILISVGLPIVALWHLPGDDRSRRRTIGVAAWLLLAAGVTAHDLRSPAWHQTQVAIGDDNVGVEQEILLSGKAREQLRAAPEVLLVMDLRIRGDALSRLRVEVNGRSFPGEALVGTLPRLGEFTLEGGPDRDGFPQWWMLRLPPDVISADDRSIRIRLLGATRPNAVLYGDRFSGDQFEYNGPSFGDWPHVAGVKFDYDADPRLSVRLPLASDGTRSAIVRADGQRRAIQGVFRIRLLLLTGNDGAVSWESAPIPAGGRSTLYFRANHGVDGLADLVVHGQKILDVRLGTREDYSVATPGFALRYEHDPSKVNATRGTFCLSGPFPPGRVLLAVHFRAGMSDDRRFFLPVLSSEADRDVCSAGSPGPLIDGVARILDSTRARYPSQTGRWRVLSVF